MPRSWLVTVVFVMCSFSGIHKGEMPPWETCLCPDSSFTSLHDVYGFMSLRFDRVACDDTHKWGVFGTRELTWETHYYDRSTHLADQPCFPGYFFLPGLLQAYGPAG